MHVLKYCIRNDQWKCQISRKNQFTKVFAMQKKGDGNTCTELIPTCSSKKVMWLHITWLASRQISLHSLSVFKVFLYNCLPELSYTSAFPDSRHPPLLWGTSNLLYMKIIQWLLLLFLVIFSASLSESDHFVLFDSFNGKGALFANVLHNMMES